MMGLRDHPFRWPTASSGGPNADVWSPEPNSSLSAGGGSPAGTIPVPFRTRLRDRPFRRPPTLSGGPTPKTPGQSQYLSVPGLRDHPFR